MQSMTHAARRTTRQRRVGSTIAADPYDFEFEPARCALLIIDMQRDFLEPGASARRSATTSRCCARRSSRTGDCCTPGARPGLPVMHTREGHRPDLADLPAGQEDARPRRRRRSAMPGRWDASSSAARPDTTSSPSSTPLPDEPVIDKPGKGAFFATDLHAILQNRGIAQLFVTGVTTEVCVHTTVREANDRGYDCCVLEDCVGSYFPEFQRIGLQMIRAQGGIFGWVSHSDKVLAALDGHDQSRKRP